MTAGQLEPLADSTRPGSRYPDDERPDAVGA
jgi:hypothetical protein